MAIRVLEVAGGSLADGAGIRPGDILLRINGEPVIDEIDYQALTARRRLNIELRGADGRERSIPMIKSVSTPLGIVLDERAVLSPRSCANRCVFCFVDQLPSGMRESLYVKDDDWRLSLMMGNFVTLTNVNDEEFSRIIKRKASPLYISVHATDPEVRSMLLGNPSAGNLMPRLRIMKENGLHFHCQAVICPGLNDGAVLHQTIVDLAALYPAALSLAIVPVGLTTHRQGLSSLKLFDREGAREVLQDMELIQDYYYRTLGTRFVFPSDEFYSIAERPVPSDESYEGYPQIENGVGMLRLMTRQCEEAWPDIQAELSGKAPRPGRRLVIPTGYSALSFIQGLVEKYAPRDAEINVIPVENRYFGKTVTVTGLIVGRDLLDALNGAEADEALISESMLRENTDTFLDDMTLRELESRLPFPVRVVRNTGECFLRALYGLEG